MRHPVYFSIFHYLSCNVLKFQIHIPIFKEGTPNRINICCWYKMAPDNALLILSIDNLIDNLKEVSKTSFSVFSGILRFELQYQHTQNITKIESTILKLHSPIGLNNVWSWILHIKTYLTATICSPFTSNTTAENQAIGIMKTIFQE